MAGGAGRPACRSAPSLARTRSGNPAALRRRAHPARSAPGRPQGAGSPRLALGQGGRSLARPRSGTSGAPRAPSGLRSASGPVWRDAPAPVQPIFSFGADCVCAACPYRVNIVRTGPQGAKPEHDGDNFQRLCHDDSIRYSTRSSCSKLDKTYRRLWEDANLGPLRHLSQTEAALGCLRAGHIRSLSLGAAREDVGL